MRALTALAAALFLASCGNSEDFTVDVAMPADVAKARLAELDGGAELGGMSLPQLKIDGSERRELAFAISGVGEGNLHFTFEDLGPKATRIHVALSLPAKEMLVGNRIMVLSEAKAEKELRKVLADWSEQSRGGAIASPTDLNQFLTALDFAMQPNTTQARLARMEGTGLRDLFDREEAEAGPPELAFGEADDAQGIDPSRGIEDAARPMDEATGTPASEDAGYYD